MFIQISIKFDTMEKGEIEDRILAKTEPKEPITASELWVSIGKPNKNKYYEILHEMISKEWLRKTNDGIVRTDFHIKKELIMEDTWIKNYSKEMRDTIAKRHKPLMRVLKGGSYQLSKKAEEDLQQYFHEIDYLVLNLQCRNFLAHRLNLITPKEYKKYLKELENRFDYLFNGLVNDHKSFKKHLIQHYIGLKHTAEFKV